MQYTIIHDGKSYDIPNYTMGVAGEIEKVELFKVAENPFDKKCKKMYDFISDKLGKENTIEVVGEFLNADPNTINIIYLKIVASYNRPLEEYQNEQSQTKLDDAQIDKVTALLSALGNSKDALKVIK